MASGAEVIVVKCGSGVVNGRSRGPAASADMSLLTDSVPDLSRESQGEECRQDDHEKEKRERGETSRRHRRRGIGKPHEFPHDSHFSTVTHVALGSRDVPQQGA